MSRPIQTWLWVPTPQGIAVAAGATVPLAAKRTRVSFVTIFADQANSVTVSIGPPGLTVAANSTPNVAYFQLDAGRSATINTDNVDNEYFDLHDFAAAHPDVSATQRIYVTVYRAMSLGLSG